MMATTTTTAAPTMTATTTTTTAQTTTTAATATTTAARTTTTTAAITTAAPTTMAVTTTTSAAPTTNTVATATTTAGLTTTTMAATPNTATITTATAGPTVTNTATTAMPTTTAAPTAATVTTTNAVTATETNTIGATTVINPAPVTEAITNKNLTFRSLNATFSSDLLDQSSPAYKSRSSRITTQLTPVFKRGFPSFVKLNVLGFREGSVFNILNLQFLSSSVPNNTQLAKTLISAAPNVTGFDIEISSITIDGIPITSSGINQNISLITAFSLVLLSRLLSSQQ
ncbi:hypothetical protein JOB18_002538 [Solea senegalensis]|uniref:SEA domain-containing protein n=1 Tax=Solea senegalensis TaxID=28829 RepID=A0AAV6QR83_SOLSE|nr:uncharacterized protein DDB_G0290587-like [Solea senegalensis]KAG7495591.1 hypothetical protein JOB18_002538 [Solea senegalensis]